MERDSDRALNKAGYRVILSLHLALTSSNRLSNELHSHRIQLKNLFFFSSNNWLYWLCWLWTGFLVNGLFFCCFLVRLRFSKWSAHFRSCSLPAILKNVSLRRQIFPRCLTCFFLFSRSVCLIDRFIHLLSISSYFFEFFYQFCLSIY